MAPNLLPIGTFSRATHLSVRTLRRYHEQGLLRPAVVDPSTRYRAYSPAQLADAALIQRLRELDVPLEDVRRVLDARDPAVTQQVLERQRARLRAQLSWTEDALQRLDGLRAETLAQPVALREQGAQEVASVTTGTSLADLPAFLADAYDELYAVLRRYRQPPAGPPGARFAGAEFDPEALDVEAFVPVSQRAVAAGRVRPARLPPCRLAAVVHAGGYDDVGGAYRRLGAFVAGEGLQAAGPMQELYLVGPEVGDVAAQRTEVAWPVTDVHEHEEETS